MVSGNLIRVYWRVSKDKLRAFLITADATRSVLSGKSIDDVVEETITEDVDDKVLDYMNKLLGKVKWLTWFR